MANELTIQVVHPPRERWGSVLNLALSQRPYAERLRLAEGLAWQPAHQRRDAGFDGLFEARANDQTVGAALVVLQPGHTALVYQPRLTAAAPTHVAKLLQQKAETFLKVNHVRLAQEVLPLDARDDAERARGFGHSIEVELLYLAADQSRFPAAPPAGELSFEPYKSSDQPRMEALLARTYVGSLDCPELNGVRSSADTIAGYQATGVVDLSHWCFVRYQNADLGCLLIARHDDQTAELIYVGLVPEARGRGWSRAVLAWALWLAREARCATLTVAVDRRNIPAMKGYEATGFVQFDARRVMLRVLS